MNRIKRTTKTIMNTILLNTIYLLAQLKKKNAQHHAKMMKLKIIY